MLRIPRLAPSLLTALTITALPAVALAHQGRDAAAPAPAGALQSVGSVVSFTGGILAIETGDGSVVTGKVVERTRVRCTRPAPVVVAARADGRQGEREGIGAPAGATGAQGPAGIRLRRCDSAGISAGTKILVADLVLTGDGAIWRKVGYLASIQVPQGATAPGVPVAARQR